MAEKKKRVSDVVELDGVKYSCRVYDNGGETLDRYTICLARRKTTRGGSVYPFLACNSEPFHGIGQHGESPNKIDGKHLGKRVEYATLPEEVKRFIKQNLE